MKTSVVHIVGGGLAGSEAAWQVLRQGHPVVLHEMRGKVSTEAHKTDNLAELVCSNSLKSMQPESAPGQLKYEMQALDSLILKAAYHAQVPAGQALAVDREKFSAFISEALHSHTNFSRVCEEIAEVPSEVELNASGDVWIIATGPLTAAKLAEFLRTKLCLDKTSLAFYDAIAPIISGDSINFEEGFFADRYGKGDPDYFNIPLEKPAYEEFIESVKTAEYMPLHDFENTKYFEACLPIEVMIERGPQTLRFGPMKPVGLENAEGRRPYACIQLRKETVAGTMYSMVGFQTKMKWPEQARIFGKLPSLGNAEFLRFGSVHRNTYLQSPSLLNGDLSFKTNIRVFLAGQITGVEGYTESASIGLLAGRAAVDRLRGAEFAVPPPNSVIGALLNYVAYGGKGDFSPMNANLGLLPPVEKPAHVKKIGKSERKAMQCQSARTSFDSYMSSNNLLN